jgi:hypothetical protein
MKRITRRAAWQTLGAASLAGMVFKAVAATGVVPVTAPGLAEARTAPNMLLVDESLTPGELRVPLRRALAAVPQPIESDLVVQWRKSLQRQIENHTGNVVALVRWDKALVLSGLAREHRWRTRSQRISPSVFRIELSKV